MWSIWRKASKAAVAETLSPWTPAIKHQNLFWVVPGKSTPGMDVVAEAVNGPMRSYFHADDLPVNV